MAKLALGTVQFGLDYGIKNSRGRVPESEIARIFEEARNHGIDTLDTAAAYGDSELVLGRLLEKDSWFGIVSKLRPKPEKTAREELRDSLGRLGRERIQAYLLHSFATYEANPRILREMAECKKDGLVLKTGASLYRPEEAEVLLDAGEPLDMVQVPYSILDRRFESVFGRLRDQGVEIHVRSVFLQGALLMDPEDLPVNFAPVKKNLELLHALARGASCSLSSICLGFAALNPNIDRIVIGVDGIDDFLGNVAAFEGDKAAREVLKQLPDIGTIDESIILPFNWTKK